MASFVCALSLQATPAEPNSVNNAKAKRVRTGKGTAGLLSPEMALQHRRSRAAKEVAAGLADAEPDPPRILHRRRPVFHRLARDPGAMADS
jgi:hypothetical protein